MRVALGAPQLAPRAQAFLQGPETLPFDPNTLVSHFRKNVDAYIQNADENFNSAFSNSTIKVFPHNPVRIENTQIENVNVRCYIPEGAHLKPCVLYFTGSGFVYSNLEWQKRNCLDLAKMSGFIVINVQERCAPEHRFPMNLLDAFSVLKWIAQNGATIGIDPNNINLCGFSSGGNVAAVLARWARDENILINHQVLISPWLDLMHEYLSYHEFGKNYGLQRDVLKWMVKQYVPENFPLNNPDISPFYENNLEGVATATIIVGECEPFHDESEIYTAKLKNAGVRAEFIPLIGQIHEVAGCNRWRIASPECDPIRLAVQGLRNSR